MPIRYYSTNRYLNNVAGIVPFTASVSFKEALLMGQAPDEGLFVPDSIPHLSISDILKLRDKPYWQIAMLVAQAFLSDEFSAEILEAVVKGAYNFPVPLEAVYPRAFIMRLDQGPTASFKDFAARMMARLMSHCRAKGERINILVATSGDTGSAVGEAFKGVAGIDVTILYPAAEVSLMQKKQLDTIGGNVQALCVEGKFDDCQNLVKVAFSDPELAKFNLSSANSINIGRILQSRADKLVQKPVAFRVWVVSNVAGFRRKISGVEFPQDRCATGQVKHAIRDVYHRSCADGRLSHDGVSSG